VFHYKSARAREDLMLDKKCRANGQPGIACRRLT